MKRLPALALLFFSTALLAQEQIATPIVVGDSIRVISFYSEVLVKKEPEKAGSAGISTDIIRVKMEKDRKDRSFEFEFPKNTKIVAQGAGTETESDEIEWKYDWRTGEVYRLLITVAPDSAGNFSLYSGYVFLPREGKWKLLGTCRLEGRSSPLQHLYHFHSIGKNALFDADMDIAIQRNNGSWKTMTDNMPIPVVSVSNHVDSVTRQQEEIRIIEEAIRAGKTPAKENKDGVYYSILQQGTGRQVAVTDTVTVHYKGYLFSNNEVFDQTKETPARFPLNRLIRGWQVAVPLLNVGGKIIIVIPSHLAYSVRTRASRIPPNSILVFEVEVLDAVPAK